MRMAKLLGLALVVLSAFGCRKPPAPLPVVADAVVRPDVAASPAPLASLVPNARGCLRGYLWRHRTASGTFTLRRRATAWSPEPTDRLLDACLLGLGENALVDGQNAPSPTRATVDPPMRPDGSRPTATCTLRQDPTVTSALNGAVHPLVRDQVAEAVQRVAVGCREAALAQPGTDALPQQLHVTVRHAFGVRDATLTVTDAGPLTPCLREHGEAQVIGTLHRFAAVRSAPTWQVDVAVAFPTQHDLLGDREVLTAHDGWLPACLRDHARCTSGRFGASSGVLAGPPDDCVDAAAHKSVLTLTIPVNDDGSPGELVSTNADLSACDAFVQERLRFEPGGKREVAVRLVELPLLDGKAKPPAGSADFVLSATPVSPPLAKLDARLKPFFADAGPCMADYVPPDQRGAVNWQLRLTVLGDGHITQPLVTPDADGVRDCLLTPLLDARHDWPTLGLKTAFTLTLRLTRRGK